MQGCILALVNNDMKFLVRKKKLKKRKISEVLLGLHERPTATGKDQELFIKTIFDLRKEAAWVTP
jgi:hypothetical protein